MDNKELHKIISDIIKENLDSEENMLHQQEQERWEEFSDLDQSICSLLDDINPTHIDIMLVFAKCLAVVYGKFENKEYAMNAFTDLCDDMNKKFECEKTGGYHKLRDKLSKQLYESQSEEAS